MKSAMHGVSLSEVGFRVDHVRNRYGVQGLESTIPGSQGLSMGCTTANMAAAESKTSHDPA